VSVLRGQAIVTRDGRPSATALLRVYELYGSAKSTQIAGRKLHIKEQKSTSALT